MNLLKRIGVFFGTGLIFFSICFTGIASASFNQNNVIDDSVFNNNNSMNANQIDNFLNTFPSTCIGTRKGFNAQLPIGYSHSSGFTYGGNTSAGNVIMAAANVYQINPQVILTTLEKEQSLVTGGTGCNALAYTAAAGYGCPDGGPANGYTYSSVNLYSVWGNEVTSVSGTCVNSTAKAGFSQQVIHAAWLLKFGEQRSEGNVGWSVITGSWNNSDDPQSCYGGPITPGYRISCPGSTSVYYDGYKTIDNVSVIMSTGATAALYWYTPHFHGNQLFDTIFTQWFGSTAAMFGNIQSSRSIYAQAGCNSSAYSSDKIGRLYNPDTGDYFYTSYAPEACSAIKLGYIWDGIVMQTTTGPNSVPVYRLSNGVRHFFTIDPAVRASYISNGYNDEGISFYAYSSSQQNSLPVYQLDNGPTTILTSAGAEGQYFQVSLGYQPVGVVFYTPNIDTNGDTPILRLSNMYDQKFYTISSSEASMTQTYNGYHSEGNILFGNEMPDVSNEPIYRLSGYGGHFYTANRGERDAAVINYGYISEGIGFYEPNSTYPNSQSIYRSSNSLDGYHLFTKSISESYDSQTYYGFSQQGAGWYAYSN